MTKSISKNLPKATHFGDVHLNGFDLSSVVLEDGRRLFSDRSLAYAFGIRGGGAYYKRKKNATNDSAVLPEYLSASFLKPFISNELIEKFDSAVEYTAKNGKKSRGIDATVLADICDVYVTAKNKGVDNDNFLKVADNAYTMIKAFAKVGIIALVDEATGYQYDREKEALQQILKLYVAEDILEWQKTFHDPFYQEIFRLRKWPFTTNGINSRPGVVGTYTNTFIYGQMPIGVMDKIRAVTPKNKKGHYVYKFHQSLTPEIGKEHLKKQLIEVTTLMSISQTWQEFIDLFNRKYKKQGKQLSIDFGEEEEKQKNEMNATEFDRSLKGIMAAGKPPPFKGKETE